ncbi:MAG: hypothetical protein J7L45_01420 [Candidatus Aenigmarchaeota archaeon]|nr:hypothetical protein [Candidatus Aenigmarchaeota archaeon]
MFKRVKREFSIEEMKNYIDEGKFVLVENYIIKKEMEGSISEEEIEELRKYLERSREPPWWKPLKKLSYHSLCLTLRTDDSHD